MSCIVVAPLFLSCIHRGPHKDDAAAV